MARSTSHKAAKKTPSTHWYRWQFRTRMDNPRTCKLLRICADGTYPPCLCRVQPNQCLGSFFFCVNAFGRQSHSCIRIYRRHKRVEASCLCNAINILGAHRACWLEYWVSDLQVSDCLRIAKTIGVFPKLKAPWLGLLVMGYKTRSPLSLQVILALTGVF